MLMEEKVGAAVVRIALAELRVTSTPAPTHPLLPLSPVKAPRRLLKCQGLSPLCCLYLGWG